MDESARKKTMLAWQPPAAAGRGDPTLIAPAAPPPGPPSTEPSAEADGEALADPAAEAVVPAVVPGTSMVRPTEHAARERAIAKQVGLEVTQQLLQDPAALAPALEAPAHVAPSAESRPLAPGDRIGNRYIIKALAGEGGFAAVYRCADNEIPNHEVAVKLLNAPATGPAAQAVALREITLIASVSHPSVVQFKDYGWHDGRLFFAMPWYKGRTLADTALPLDRASARRVFERCAYGLQAMHEAGICHYDIKPDNIFLADIAGFEVGFPVLLDLGIAAKRGEAPVALTPEYASPETARAIMDGGKTPVGTAADVYALALSLRNVLDPDTAPQLGESIPAFLHHRATVAVPPPTAKDLRYLAPRFQRWLSLDPSERPSAAEFALELAELTAPEEQRAERKRMILRAAPIVLVLALMVTALAFALKSKTKELVHQKAVAARESAQTSARLEQLKQDSKNQLDEKMQLALELESQRDKVTKERDATQKQLASTEADRNRTRAELSRRTKDLAQTKDDLQKQTGVLDQTRADLAQRSRDLDERTRSLAQERAALAERTQELGQRTAERDRVQADLVRKSRDFDAESARLAATQADLDSKNKELERRTKERDRLSDDLTKRERELARVQADLDKRERELVAAQRELREANAELAQRNKQLERSARNAPRPTAAP